MQNALVYQGWGNFSSNLPFFLSANLIYISSRVTDNLFLFISSIKCKLNALDAYPLIFFHYQIQSRRENIIWIMLCQSITLM